jgi:catechol 2,3-dioxygenase-like lactoylglutathione lyase family enzyme
MAAPPDFEISATVLGTPDPQGLARFYRELLGWTVVSDSPEWAQIRPAGGGSGLSFQREDEHVPPTWPNRPGEQQMMAHLDIRTHDLEAAVARALELGASEAAFQPQDDVRVMLDPAGHPFCLFLPGA